MLAENIGKYRVLRGYTQQELAERCSVTKEAIKYWESGVHEPSSSNLLQLSRVLGVEPGTLLGVGKNDCIYVGKLNEQDRTILIELAQRLMNDM